MRADDAKRIEEVKKEYGKAMNRFLGTLDPKTDDDELERRLVNKVQSVVGNTLAPKRP